MAEILVLAFDTFGPDDAADRLAWKLGHVVDVKPDGHPWGAMEGLPKFWKIKLPGIPVANVTKFLEAKLDLSDPNNPVQSGLRKYKLGVNDVPTAIRNALVSTGEITITKNIQSTINDYMKLVT